MIGLIGLSAGLRHARPACFYTVKIVIKIVINNNLSDIVVV